MCAKSRDSQRITEIRNAKAFRDYAIDHKFEAGVVLRGTEVKSIRNGRAQINDSFGRMEKGEVWMFNAHIEPYDFGTVNNHNVRRQRKLLLHKHEVRKIAQALDAGGKSLVPLRMYFKNGLVKVEVALATGKKQFDKRDDLKKRVETREMDRALKTRR